MSEIHFNRSIGDINADLQKVMDRVSVLEIVVADHERKISRPKNAKHSWTHEVYRAMMEHKESWDDVICHTLNGMLDKEFPEFCDGEGLNVWTKDRVYFVNSAGECGSFVDSAPRNPPELP